jgi:Fe2+ or Zn2+ uptake regulation protein
MVTEPIKDVPETVPETVDTGDLNLILDKFKEKNETLSAFIRSFFTQSPGALRADAFDILKLLSENKHGPLSQKQLLKVIAPDDDSVSLSSLRRRLKALTQSGLVYEFNGSFDQRNTYYKISPEIKGIMSHFCDALDQLENRSALSIDEFISKEISKRLHSTCRVYSKKIRHGYILFGITLLNSKTEKFCSKNLCTYCRKIVRTILNTIFPSYEFNVITEDRKETEGGYRCAFRYTLRPDVEEV